MSSSFLVHNKRVDVATWFSNSLMKFKMNMYKLKEGREMKASTFSKLVSTSLYEKR